MCGKVLLVDDEPDLLAGLRYFLEDEGHEVATAPDAGMALRLLASERPDVIVCDMHLSGMNGLEFCEAVRANPRWQAIPVILSTGVLDRSLVRKGRELGVTDFLAKPFDLDALLAVLRNGRVVSTGSWCVSTPASA